MFSALRPLRLAAAAYRTVRILREVREDIVLFAGTSRLTLRGPFKIPREDWLLT